MAMGIDVKEQHEKPQTHNGVELQHFVLDCNLSLLRINIAINEYNTM